MTFRAATANSTVDGLKNSAVGTVGARQFKQTMPEMGSTNDDNALEQILGTSIFGQSGQFLAVRMMTPIGRHEPRELLWVDETSVRPSAATNSRSSVL